MVPTVCDVDCSCRGHGIFLRSVAGVTRDSEKDLTAKIESKYLCSGPVHSGCQDRALITIRRSKNVRCRFWRPTHRLIWDRASPGHRERLAVHRDGGVNVFKRLVDPLGALPAPPCSTRLPWGGSHTNLSGWAKASACEASNNNDSPNRLSIGRSPDVCSCAQANFGSSSRAMQYKCVFEKNSTSLPGPSRGVPWIRLKVFYVVFLFGASY